MSAQDKVAADLRAGAIAHCIRLGKCPRPGQVLGGTAQILEGEQEDFEAGRFDKAMPQSDRVEIEFVVEQADIDRAIQLINTQRATYKEPKTTKVQL